MERSRRAVLASSLTLLGAPLAGCQQQGTLDRGLRFSSLDEAEAELTRLLAAPALRTSSEFNWSQTLQHCAQSIVFSMTGYPEPKSALFQRSVGAGAYRFFAWRGRMTHDLSEPIPGAATLDAQIPATHAVQSLLQAMRRFRHWQGALQPHFAYGSLSRADYELAHAMHVANHFSAFAPTAIVA